AEELGISIIIQNEAFTSKTCGCCGNVQDINGKKVYRCSKCGIALDRDINGARGISFKRCLMGPCVCTQETIDTTRNSIACY
ncbi:15590_t:CDS:1, partial [Rhizophagus irregularis]